MIRYANIDDLEILTKHDEHISKEELINQINLNVMKNLTSSFLF